MPAGTSQADKPTRGPSWAMIAGRGTTPPAGVEKSAKRWLRPCGERVYAACPRFWAAAALRGRRVAFFASGAASGAEDAAGAGDDDDGCAAS